ncbi:MAG: DNA N-6-adenine-methyltransferase [Cyanobacteriota bacterium]|nr:DNA N-6-adenine-methyltransferase [Cyanobacteriota bacterium]
MLKKSLHFGGQLQQHRKQQKLNQQQLADKTGLSIPTIRQLERSQGYLSSFQTVLDALALQIIGRNLPQGDTFGQQLALLRQRRSINQRDFALTLGITQPTLINVERYSKGKLVTLEQALILLGAGAYLARLSESKAFYSHAGNSSGQNSWTTPAWVLDKLYDVFGCFDLDPCSPTATRKTAPVKAKIYYTEADDGLSLPWHGHVFVNPPYGRTLKDWVAKCHHEATTGNTQTIVALIPARTDTAYWHDYIANQAAIVFLRGRLSFGNTGESAPFPSALIVWGGETEKLQALRSVFADAWVVPGR